MFTTRKATDILLLSLLFLVAVAMSIKGLREPDLWWQIRTGEWILAHGQVPHYDVFSYTYTGSPWVNVKWISEVLLALAARLGGPESVFLWQALVTCGIVFFLLKLADLSSEVAPGKAPVVFSVLLVLLAIEYRIIGRPEMFSHFFSVVFLWLLYRYHLNPGKQLWWLVPLQILWANTHEAFGMGVVLTALFCAGDWLQYTWGKYGKWFTQTKRPLMLTLVLVAQVASLAVNPYGIQLLLQPFKIFGQVYENKYTTELFDFRTLEYWQWNTWLVLLLVLVAVLGNVLEWRSKKTSSNKWLLFVQTYGLGYLLTLMAFTYLASSAYRNIVFFVLMLFPFLVRAMVFFGRKLFSNERALYLSKGGVTVLLLVTYSLIVSNTFYKLIGSRDSFGLQVRTAYNPVAAADFVQAQNLTGKCFSDYLTSSYLLWRLQPDFKSFIDLRDLDVFPASFFNEFAEAVTFPEEFERLDSIHHFSYVVLYRPQFNALHRHLYNNSRFRMALLNEVAVVYTPAQDTLRLPSYSEALPKLQGRFSLAVNYLLNPFYAFTKSVNEVNTDAVAASYYLAVGDLPRARQQLSGKTNDYQLLQLSGELAYNAALAADADTTTEALTKEQHLATALSYYMQSLQLKDDYGPTYLGLGAVYFQQQNYLTALEHFEKATRYDKTNLNAWLFAAECCKVMVNRNNEESAAYARQAISFLQKAEQLNPDNPPMMLNIGFLYFRLNDCVNTRKYLLPIKDFEGFGPEQKTNIAQCLTKCAG
ncbi:MAG: hypothetical protein IPN22_11500 [Bacteroidetes bacterium]|nr:hypothetical protein [Bacteroidota bacterium]